MAREASARETRLLRRRTRGLQRGRELVRCAMPSGRCTCGRRNAGALGAAATRTRTPLTGSSPTCTDRSPSPCCRSSSRHPWTNITRGAGPLPPCAGHTSYVWSADDPYAIVCLVMATAVAPAGAATWTWFRRTMRPTMRTPATATAMTRMTRSILRILRMLMTVEGPNRLAGVREAARTVLEHDGNASLTNGPSERLATSRASDPAPSPSRAHRRRGAPSYRSRGSSARGRRAIPCGARASGRPWRPSRRRRPRQTCPPW